MSGISYIGVVILVIIPKGLFQSSQTSSLTTRFNLIQNNHGRFLLDDLGANTVKWITLDPCLGLSESDPKLYTNFKFHEIEIHKHLENIWIYKAEQIMFT